MPKHDECGLTVFFVSYEASISKLTLHKRRAALAKIIIVVKLTIKHSLLSFRELMLHIILPFFFVVNRFFKYYSKNIQKY